MTEVERFTAIKEKTVKASESVIRLEERYKAERQKLELLVKTITEKGYEPTKLAETKNAKATELNQILTDLEKEVNDIQSKINLIEANTNV